MKCLVLAALMMLYGHQREATAGTVLHRQKSGLIRSAPLDDMDTNRRIRDMARAAQQQDPDTQTRLILSAQKIQDKTNLYICCLHANILDFYLRNILKTEEHFPHLSSVRTDLARVSRDLVEQGCAIKQVNDHEHNRMFREQFFKMGEKAKTKAIGEIDILFDYLYTFC